MHDIKEIINYLIEAIDILEDVQGSATVYTDEAGIDHKRIASFLEKFYSLQEIDKSIDLDKDQS